MANDLTDISFTEQRLGASATDGTKIVSLNATYLNSLKSSYGNSKYITTSQFETLLPEAEYIIMFKKSGSSYVMEYIPRTGDTIAANSYDGDTNIIQVMFPSNVTRINQYAFRGCSNLQYANLQNMSYVIMNAFSGSSLAGVITMKNPTLIQTGAFRGTKITEFNVESCANALFEGNDIFRGCTNLTKVSLPNNVTSIPNYCFYGDTNLTTFAFPTGCTLVSTEAFRDCTKLAITVNLPNLTTLSGFYNSGIVGVENLGRVTQPYGNQVFASCKSLTYAKLPSTMTSLGNYLFQNCTALATVYVYATTPPSYGTAPFQGCTALTRIYVPSASVNSYKSATGWANHASIIAGM